MYFNNPNNEMEAKVKTGIEKSYEKGNWMVENNQDF